MDLTYKKLFSVRGIPVYVHWTVLLLLAFEGGTRPGAWLGCMLIVLVHELGHAWVARRVELDVLAVEIHGLGGTCTHEATRNGLHRSLIAWGGVLFQSILLAGTIVLSSLFSERDGVGSAYAPLLFGRQSVGLFAELRETLISVNFWMILFNLIPVAPLDGAQAWKLPGLLRSRWRQRQKTRNERRTKPTPVRRASSRSAPHLRLVRAEAEGGTRTSPGEQTTKREDEHS